MCGLVRFPHDKKKNSAIEVGIVILYSKENQQTKITLIVKLNFTCNLCISDGVSLENNNIIINFSKGSVEQK